MADKNFVKGLNVKTQKTQYGEIIKCGINLDEFCENNKINDRGYINFDLKKGKESGKWYAEINTYKQQFAEDEPVVNISDEEISF